VADPLTVGNLPVTFGVSPGHERISETVQSRQAIVVGAFSSVIVQRDTDSIKHMCTKHKGLSSRTWL